MCTVCVHLAWTQMAHRQAFESRQPGQSDSNEPTNIASDLEYGNDEKPLENWDFSRNDLGNNQYYKSKRVDRVKRHAGHSHAPHHDENHIEMNSNTERFIEKIFNQFSNGDQKTMNLIEFEKMMKQLGLVRLIDDNQLPNVIHPDEHSSTDNGHVDHSHDAHSNETVSNQSINLLFTYLMLLKQIHTNTIHKFDCFSN